MQKLGVFSILSDLAAQFLVLRIQTLGYCCFRAAGVVTFMRFFPQLKARYDYGLLIFILTFFLISVSGCRDDQVLDMVFKRVSTILIGGSVIFVVCVVIFPVWAGEDLHDLVADNINKLGVFLEGFGGDFVANSTNDEDSNDRETKFEEYRSVFNSKSIEDSLTSQDIQAILEESCTLMST